MRIHVAAFAALYLVASCSSPEPEAITTEPLFDKFGNYECEVIPGTNICVPDDDEPCLLADGSIAPPGVECPPPTGRGDDDDSSTTGSGRPGSTGTPGRP